MFEYKIIKPDSIWNRKDEAFEDLLNKYAVQGWKVIAVSFNKRGSISKAVIERNKNRT